jgi:hypothetical protein
MKKKEKIIYNLIQEYLYNLTFIFLKKKIKFSY